jgi:transposase
MPLKYSDEIHQDIATRLSGGQTPKSISETLTISLKTIYRLKKSFIRDGSTYIAPPLNKTQRESINREALLKLSKLMKKTPTTTLKELMASAVEEGIFESAETAPDISTLHRALTRVGFKWQKPRYDDRRAQKTRVTFERCQFRKALQAGLVDPTKTLCMDETSFYVGGEQMTRAWGTKYKAPVLEKNKMGGTKVVMYLTIGYKLGADGEPLALCHYLLVPPQRSHKPLPDRVDSSEVDDAKQEKRNM